MPMHLRKVRPATRKHKDPKDAVPIAQIRTLCGLWVSPRGVLRADRSIQTGHVVCDECRKQQYSDMDL